MLAGAALAETNTDKGLDLPEMPWSNQQIQQRNDQQTIGQPPEMPSGEQNDQQNGEQQYSEQDSTRSAIIRRIIQNTAGKNQQASAKPVGNKNNNQQAGQVSGMTGNQPGGMPGGMPGDMNALTDYAAAATVTESSDSAAYSGRIRHVWRLDSGWQELGDRHLGSGLLQGTLRISGESIAASRRYG